MKWWKVTLVIFGAVIITALGIDAADTLTGSQGTLLSQVISTGSSCPKGMVPVESVPTLTCVDAFEASASSKCPAQNPEQLISSVRNVEFADCNAVSEKALTPWRFISRDQAMQMCARAGKRLPTSEEWYALALGMADVEARCNVASGMVHDTGGREECMSPQGVYDLVGNVWEWVSDDVIDGQFQNRSLPESGYVEQVDASGIATISSTAPNELFGEDYFWSAQSGAFGIIRGGYYDSGADAGIFAVHSDTVPTTASIGIGFRCVK